MIRKLAEYTSSLLGLSFGKILGLIRLAIVGKLSGADLFMTLEIIGKKNAIKRIEALISHIK